MATSKIVAVSRSIRGLLIEQCRNEDDESHRSLRIFPVNLCRDWRQNVVTTYCNKFICMCVC